MSNSASTKPLAALREVLVEARTADDAERIHAALIEVVEGLLAHVDKQNDLIAALQSDLSHKQGIVTAMDGGLYKGPRQPVDPADADAFDL